jgi:hypothetical protein
MKQILIPGLGIIVDMTSTHQILIPGFGIVNETGATLPTITTGVIAEITTKTALVSGNVTSDGGKTVTERGFCFNKTSFPTTADNKIIVSGTTGAYSGYLTSLDPETTYYVRAYAINEAGTGYGSDVSFLTSSPVDILVPGTGFYIEMEMSMGRSKYYKRGITVLMIGAPIGYPIP